VQDEIAKAIADALQVTLGTAEQEAIAARGTTNLDAYELYLLGRHDWSSRGFERLKRAQKYFEDAVEQDPNFAMAWVGLADTLFVMPWYDKDATPDQLLPRARGAVERALELDPGLGEAWTTLASIAHEFEWDFDKSERLFEKAIELNPNHATTWHWYCNMLQTLDRPDEARDACTKALRLDPLSPIINMNYAAATSDSGDREQGLEAMQHTVELDPDWPIGVHGLAMDYLQLGRYEEAADTLERWAQIRRYPDPSLARTIIAGVEDPNKREAALSALEKMASEDRASAFMSLMQFYGLLGDVDTAWAIIEQGVEAHHPNVAFLGTASGIDSLREDPRVIALMEELGLPNGGRAYRQSMERNP
jgi:tetratricopeptide (TPR) repeat protein